MKKHLLIIAGILCLFASCENELPFDVLQPEMDIVAEQQDDFVPNEGMIQLGKKLENPYSVANMRKALELLPTESRSGFSAEDIQPTHLYVKFKPKNVEELDSMLWSDSTLDFYDFPLDYEQISGGSYYHDPSLPENVPTYQYASIPVGRPIPEVCEYEILEELYIPDELSDYTRTLSPAFINAIVAKSFEITGNERTSDAVATHSDGRTRASYSFWGKIRVYDTLTRGYVPVPGARIKCKYWFTTVSAYTDINGEYSVVRESLNRYTYYIYWERTDKYDVRDGELTQAKTEGPETSGGWSLDITNSSLKNRNFATITRAAYRYFYGNRGGVYQQVPPSTGNLKICYMHNEAHEEGWMGYFSPTVSFGVAGDIWLYSKDLAGNAYTTDDIFATAVHEMGHANMYSTKTLLSYNATDSFIKESWSEFIQGYLTYLEYGELGLYDMDSFSFETYCVNYGIGIGGAWTWSSTSNDNYSSLFIDLYDDFNQRTKWGSDYPNDNIVGYTPSTLNSIVNTSETLGDVRTKLKANKPAGVTDAMINELIDFFNTYKPQE